MLFYCMVGMPSRTTMTRQCVSLSRTATTGNVFQSISSRATTNNPFPARPHLTLPCANAGQSARALGSSVASESLTRFRRFARPAGWGRLALVGRPHFNVSATFARCMVGMVTLVFAEVRILGFGVKLINLVSAQYLAQRKLTNPPSHTRSERTATSATWTSSNCSRGLRNPPQRPAQRRTCPRAAPRRSTALRPRWAQLQQRGE